MLTRRALAQSRRPAHHLRITTKSGGNFMSALSRRRFLALTGSAAALLPVGPSPAGAAMGPADKFDLVIKGGEVLDPSQSLRGKRDIGIRWGMIEAIEADIPAARITKSIDASGKLVTPG